jgi:hypothetical protein
MVTPAGPDPLPLETHGRLRQRPQTQLGGAIGITHFMKEGLCEPTSTKPS